MGTLTTIAIACTTFWIGLLIGDCWAMSRIKSLLKSIADAKRSPKTKEVNEDG